jgi:hypothetical protein
MKRVLLAGAAAVTVSTPAFPITPEELWSAWQAQNASPGQRLAATGTAREGDTLVLTGVTLTVEPEGGELSVRTEVGTVRMRDAGGGRVVVTMPDSIAVTLDSTGADAATARLGIEQPGLTITASGDPAAIAYEVAAPRVAVTLTEATSGGKALPVALRVAMEAMTATYRTAGAETQTVDGRFALGALRVDTSGSDPEGGGSFDIEVAVADLAGSVEGTLPPGFADEPDLGVVLRQGFAIASDYTLGATTFAFNAIEDGKAVSAEGKADGGDFRVAMDANRFAYRTGAKGFDITLAGGDLPFPALNIQLADFALGFLLPLAKTADPADFSALVRVVDLVLPDEVWAMVDPMGSLKRGAVTAILDTAGKLRLTADLFAPEAMMGAAPPGELHALDIRALQLKAGGADLTGTGGFTFDNGDLATFDGLPRPTGAIDLKLVGGNALLDALAAMGMIPEDQIMGARMMLGLFARPGDGPDTLVSRIEVTPDGALLANGQRLR